MCHSFSVVEHVGIAKWGSAVLRNARFSVFSRSHLKLILTMMSLSRSSRIASGGPPRILGFFNRRWKLARKFSSASSGKPSVRGWLGSALMQA